MVSRSEPGDQPGTAALGTAAWHGGVAGHGGVHGGAGPSAVHARAADRRMRALRAWERGSGFSRKIASSFRLKAEATGGTWNLERGTWNVEPGTWNVEPGTWNWNVEAGT